MPLKKKLNLKLVTTIALALIIGFFSYKSGAVQAPFPTWLDKYWAREKVPLGIEGQRLVKAVYDTAIHQSATSTNGLGVYLPANAVITRSWFYVRTAMSGNPGARVAFQCEDANNIKTSTDMTALAKDTMVEGASTGTAATFVTNIGAQCQISAVLIGDVMSTGAAEIYINYVVHD